MNPEKKCHSAEIVAEKKGISTSLGRGGGLHFVFMYLASCGYKCKSVQRFNMHYWESTCQSYFCIVEDMNEKPNDNLCALKTKKRGITYAILL